MTYKLTDRFDAVVQIPAIGSLPGGTLKAVFLIPTDELDAAQTKREKAMQETLSGFTNGLLEISNDTESSEESKQLRVQGISLQIVREANQSQQNLMRDFLTDRLVEVEGAEEADKKKARDIVLGSSFYRAAFFSAYTQAANEAIEKK